MYQVKIRTHFSAAHSLRGYQGECERLHGHNWKVEVIAYAKKINEKTGILIDFKYLKSITKEIINQLDHQYLNELAPFNQINPTAENIAYYLYQNIQKNIQPPNYLDSVTIWETETACATYKKDNTT